MRRDLLDSYEAIAARVADEIRPPPPEEPVEYETEEEPAQSGFMKVAVIVLAIVTMVFAGLYWQREQSWRDMQAQNADGVPYTTMRLCNGDEIDVMETIEELIELPKTRGLECQQPPASPERAIRSRRNRSPRRHLRLVKSDGS